MRAQFRDAARGRAVRDRARARSHASRRRPARSTRSCPCPSCDTVTFAKTLATDAAVLVIPGVAFGSLGEGFVRISYAASLDEIGTRNRAASAAGCARPDDETQQRPKLATASPRIQYHSRRHEVEVETRQRKIAGTAADRLGRRVRDLALPQRPQDQEGARARRASASRSGTRRRRFSGRTTPITTSTPRRR